MDRTRFGIIGCGAAAVPVCEAIHNSEAAEIVVACDVDQELARDIGERFGIGVTAEVDAVLSHPEVDAVYIAVPHDLLAPFARQALEAGKHALVEKPMALTLQDADDLINLAEVRGLALGVFYELRYATPFVHARQLVRAGAIGRVIGVRIQTLIDKPAEYWQTGYTGRSVSPWRGQKARAGGGVLLMNTSHLLDAVRYITGLEVASVSAEIGTLVAVVEVEDTAAATLLYGNGAIGSLFAGVHLAGAAEAERCEIYGTEGQLLAPDPYAGGDLRVFLRRAWQDIPGGAWHSLSWPPADVYSCAVADFARAVQQGAPAPIDGRDARRVLAIVLAMYQSAQERQTVSL